MIASKSLSFLFLSLACLTSPGLCSQAPYTALSLSGVSPGQALRANNGTFTVQVEAQPPLQPHHRFQLMLDGQPCGRPRSDPVFKLVNIDRGEHTLAVRVLEGRVSVQETKPVRFYVQRSHRKRY